MVPFVESASPPMAAAITELTVAAGEAIITTSTLAMGSTGCLKNHSSASVIAGDHPSQVLLGNSFLGQTRIVQTDSVLEISKRY